MPITSYPSPCNGLSQTLTLSKHSFSRSSGGTGVTLADSSLPSLTSAPAGLSIPHTKYCGQVRVNEDAQEPTTGCQCFSYHQGSQTLVQSSLPGPNTPMGLTDPRTQQSSKCWCISRAWKPLPMLVSPGVVQQEGSVSLAPSCVLSPWVLASHENPCA